MVDQRRDGTRPRDRGPRLRIAVPRRCVAGGKEPFTQTAALLGGTERLVVGTGISSARGRVGGQGPPGCVRLPTRDATTPAPEPGRRTMPGTRPTGDRWRTATPDRLHPDPRGGARGAAAAQATRTLGAARSRSATSSSLSDAAVGRATREPEPACGGPRTSGAPSRWPAGPADCGCTA